MWRQAAAAGLSPHPATGEGTPPGGLRVCGGSAGSHGPLTHLWSRQHFPLYRRNDANCSGEDAAPPDEKYTPFKERYDVLSWEVSRKVCGDVGMWGCRDAGWGRWRLHRHFIFRPRKPTPKI